MVLYFLFNFELFIFQSILNKNYNYINEHVLNNTLYIYIYIFFFTYLKIVDEEKKSQ